uniref:Peptidase S1 domain-containing protein n=1 Tax=Timema poppense TaxID=170557 RepID=A0A7R9H6G5_TIMPO|nr:unnamed protein product [Timema poppensis]
MEAWETMSQRLLGRNCTQHMSYHTECHVYIAINFLSLKLQQYTLGTERPVSSQITSLASAPNADGYQTKMGVGTLFTSAPTIFTRLRLRIKHYSDLGIWKQFHIAAKLQKLFVLNGSKLATSCAPLLSVCGLQGVGSKHWLFNYGPYPIGWAIFLVGPSARPCLDNTELLVVEGGMPDAQECIGDHKDYIKSDEIYVLVGSTDWNQGGQIYDVDDHFLHPKFKMYGRKDIAIIKIKGEFSFSDTVKAIPIASRSKVPSKGEVTLAGWGRIKFYNGDSGGPVIYKGQIIGIIMAIFEDDCLTLLGPNVHTKVISYKKWVDTYLKGLYKSSICKRPPKIVGGKNVSIKEFPFMIKGKFKFTDNIQVIPIAPKSKVPGEGAKVKLVGWGWTAFESVIYYSLPHIRSERNVLDHFRYLHFNGGPNSGSDRIAKLNVGSDRNQSVLQEGDSGGPVVYNGKLIGIVSFMKTGDCMSKISPQVHTKIHTHLLKMHKPTGENLVWRYFKSNDVIFK